MKGKVIFTNKQWEIMYDGLNKNYVNLIKWLYDSHKDVLREYEKSKGNLRVGFV